MGTVLSTEYRVYEETTHLPHLQEKFLPQEPSEEVLLCGVQACRKEQEGYKTHGNIKQMGN